MTRNIRPRSFTRQSFSAIAGAFAFASLFAGNAVAQVALAGSDLRLPVNADPSADLVNLKTEETGGFGKFKIVVTNTGPVAVSGVVVTDKAGAGGGCSGNNSVTISGDGIPEGSFKIADLSGPGITLGTLSSGQSATLSYSCQGK